MLFSAGERLGPYEILALVGKGGMGEVYRARDTKLKRDVALKALPEAFSRDPERMARFQREAEVLASLNHPNIAAIYGVQERALVMEFVEGETIKGPLSVETAVNYARQIADALEGAHEKGVVHRDLKPANVKVTPEGVVKVLDFGLAAVMDASATNVGETANSPTLTMSPTHAGMILGTAAYMSPEQAHGRTADRRADIWSFGVVLYEMLSGKQAFAGESVSDTLASVLKLDPDWNALPVDTPAAIRKLLRQCLKRDRRQRIQAIGDVRLAIEEYLADPLSEAETGIATLAVEAKRPSILAWTLTSVLLLTTLILGFLHFRESPPVRQTIRYAMAGPENGVLHSIAIAPDGRQVVIAAMVNGRRQLWLRALGALQAQAMPGTEGAAYPFWSPDSRNIGFFAEGKLKRIAAGGGPAQTICDVLDGRGASWNSDDVIVFSPSGATGVAIQQVPAAGGDPADATKSKGLYRYPVFLPGGRNFLYVVGNQPSGKNGIYLGSLDGSEGRRVLADISSVVFAPLASQNTTGHLLFVRENAMMAQPFDARKAQTTGDAFPVAEGVQVSTAFYAPLTVSDSGVLIYLAGSYADSNQIVWYDRSGKLLGPVGAPGAHMAAISPDEKTVVYQRARPSGSDLWLRDLVRGTDLRFTSHASVNGIPAWSPKGDRIVFGSNRAGQFDLYQKAVGGASQEQVLLANANVKIPYQWSRQGIVYFELGTNTRQDLWVLPVNESGTPAGKPQLFLQTEFGEYDGQISPDSHWMAFTSEESGQREVYVRPFPKAEGGPWRISTAGGDQPRWRGDGKELFYLAADGKMMTVAVKPAPGPKLAFEPDTPVALFDSHIAPRGPTSLSWEYDVTADGKRFLVNTAGAAASSSPLTVVVNWNAELKK